MPYYMANARELSDSGEFHLACEKRAVTEWDRLPVLFVFKQDQLLRERMSLLRGNESAVILQNPAYVVIRRQPLKGARTNRAPSAES
jgi:hypothetical protein